MAKYDDNDKFKAMGLFKAGFSAREIAKEVPIPYSALLRIRKEAERMGTKEDLELILDTDSVVIHDLAEGIRGKLEELTEDGDEIVNGVLERVDRLQELQIDLQESGIKVLQKIDDLLDTCSEAAEIVILVDSIAKLQTAFFSKGTNVNVLNQTNNNQSDSQLSTFKSLQRSA